MLLLMHHISDNKYYKNSSVEYIDDNDKNNNKSCNVQRFILIQLFRGHFWLNTHK